MCTLGLSVALMLACAIAPASSAAAVKGGGRAGTAHAARAAARAQYRQAQKPSPPPRSAPTRDSAPPTRTDRPPNAGAGAPSNQPHPNNFVPPSGNANGARVGAPPPNVQERWRGMSPQDRQRALQNEERLKRMTPAQQEVLRDRAQVGIA